MMQSVLAAALISPAPGLDSTAARLTDARFNGIPRIDLGSAPYNAPRDATPHTMTQAAALAMYPNSTASGPIAQDTAAWKQAEYDIRTSAVRTACIIGLSPGSQMVVSEPLHSLNASKVLFHGSELPGVNLLTASCTGPALHATGGGVGAIYYGFEILAQATAQGVSTTLGGAAWTGYTAGKSAIWLDNCQGSTIDLVGWNGFDLPIVYGDNLYGIDFFRCGGSANNVNWNVNATAPLNSFERIRFIKGSLNNGNYNAKIDLTVNNTGSQGGSIFITDTAMDYPVVRQISCAGSAKTNNDSVCSNSLHVIANHMETTGACSGTTPRVYAKGAFFMTDNEVMENDTTVPLGYVEVADYTSASVINNRFNNNQMAIFWSGTANFKRVSEIGNVGQYQVVRIPKMIDGNGTSYQEVITDGQSNLIFGDPNPFNAASYYGQPDILCDYFGGAAPFTLSHTDFEVGYSAHVWCLSGAITFTLQNSSDKLTTFPPNCARLTTPGTCAIVRRESTTEWVVTGPLVA